MRVAVSKCTVEILCMCWGNPVRYMDPSFGLYERVSKLGQIWTPETVKLQGITHVGRWHFVGPLPVKSSGDKFMLVTVDAKTRWPIVAPSKGANYITVSYVAICQRAIFPVASGLGPNNGTKVGK